MSTRRLYEYPLVIRERHLDSFGHVNNAAYLEIFEEARWEMLAATGRGLESIAAERLGPTVLEVKIRFKRELRNRTPVVVKTQVEEFKGKLWYLSQWIEDQAGLVCCEARFTMGLFDLERRRLVPIPSAWLPGIGGA